MYEAEWHNSNKTVTYGSSSTYLFKLHNVHILKVQHFIKARFQTCVQNRIHDLPSGAGTILRRQNLTCIDVRL